MPNKRLNYLQQKIEPIPKFYSGKKLLITGATGFLGRVLVEKLLRDCSEISEIYILIRTKRSEAPEARAVEFFNHMVRVFIKNIF